MEDLIAPHAGKHKKMDIHFYNIILKCRRISSLVLLLSIIKLTVVILPLLCHMLTSAPHRYYIWMAKNIFVFSLLNILGSVYERWFIGLTNKKKINRYYVIDAEWLNHGCY